MKKKCDLIEALSNANGISGFEDEVLDIIKDNKPQNVLAEEDKFRNLYLRPQNSKKNKYTIMIDGHSDEVGFMVQSIKSNGQIKFLPVGGWIPHNATAQKVRIKNSNGDYISGVISSKPPHFMTESERNKAIEFNDLSIDVGANSKEEVESIFLIEVGAPVVPDVTFEYRVLNNTMIGKAFDNRLGCACVLKTLENIQNSDLEINVVGTISAQEESGLRGAKITAETVKPDLAIVFEGTPADDTFKPEDEVQSSLKKGPQIRHMDRSMISHPRFTHYARTIAKENNLPFQDAVRVGGGTNGAPIHLSNGGVPTIVIGIPVRYIHTHYGITAVEDFEIGVAWATKIIESLNAEIIDSF